MRAFAAAAMLLFLQAPDYSEAGRKALEAKDYAGAAEQFRKAVAADPGDYAAHFHLAFSLSLLGKNAEGVAEYRRVLELKPGLYQAQLNLGILLVELKQASEAVPVLRQAVEQKPAEYRPRYYLAESLLAIGDLKGAEEQYKAALERDAKSAAAELGLARAQAGQDRLEEAAAHFRKAAELDPAFRDALLELASLYEKKNQHAEAIALYQQFPDNVAARERLGQLLLETRRYREALPQLEQAYAKDPTRENQLALGTAYLLSQQLDKALPLLEKSVSAEPGNYSIRMMYGRALRDHKEYLKAAQQFHESVKLRPDSREAWNELAGMLYLMERYPQALAALDRSRQLGEN